MPADCRPAQVQEQSYQTDSTLSFDKLDHLLKECETNEAFRKKLSATGSSTPPTYEAYNSYKAGDDLMQKLVACHMEKVKKPELSTTSILRELTDWSQRMHPLLPPLHLLQVSSC